jgi:hypothetical protein
MIFVTASSDGDEDVVCQDWLLVVEQAHCRHRDASASVVPRS